MSTRARRRTTVHDLASLRLHPDGSRVQNIALLQDSEVPGVSSQTSLRASKYIAKDSRGNWIARDAGGANDVKQKYRKGDKGKGEVIDLDDVDVDEENVVDEEDVRDSRALKRRKFLHDYSFLATSGIEDELPSSSVGEPSSNTLDPSQSNVPQTLPVPSSDLLKCIHYFASEYYAAHGQLSDVAKEARKEAKKLKMQQKLEGLAKDQDVEHEEEALNLGDGDGDDEEQEEDVEKTETKPKRRGGRRPGKKWGEARIRRDMYKAFDGSALMAIGMLLQEHVAEAMGVAPPEEWEEQMEGEAQVYVERQVKGGKRRRKKDNKRIVEAEDEKGGADVSGQREESSEESSSPTSSSSSSEVSDTESDSDSNSESSE